MFTESKSGCLRLFAHFWDRPSTITNPARYKQDPHKSRTICAKTGHAHRIWEGKLLKNLARPARLERATCGFEVRRSIQLSYGRAFQQVYDKRGIFGNQAYIRQ